MSEYEYEAPEHADPAAGYQADEHLDLSIGDAIGQPLLDGGYEPAGHEGSEYVPYDGAEAGTEAGYAEATPGDGTPEGAQTYAPEAQGDGHLYAADSGDTAAPAAEDGYAAPAAEDGYAAPTTDDYTGNTVSYSDTPTDYAPTVQ